MQIGPYAIDPRVVLAPMAGWPTLPAPVAPTAPVDWKLLLIRNRRDDPLM